MSRDSRLWQDSQAHGTIFEGDVAECTKWLGTAKARLRFMLQSTPGATSVTWQPEKDVEIKVDTRPNQITISVGGIKEFITFVDTSDITASYPDWSIPPHQTHNGRYFIGSATSGYHNSKSYYGGRMRNDSVPDTEIGYSYWFGWSWTNRRNLSLSYFYRSIYINGKFCNLQLIFNKLASDNGWYDFTVHYGTILPSYGDHTGDAVVVLVLSWRKNPAVGTYAGQYLLRLDVSGLKDPTNVFSAFANSDQTDAALFAGDKELAVGQPSEVAYSSQQYYYHCTQLTETSRKMAWFTLINGVQKIYIRTYDALFHSFTDEVVYTGTANSYTTGESCFVTEGDDTILRIQVEGDKFGVLSENIISCLGGGTETTAPTTYTTIKTHNYSYSLNTKKTLRRLNVDGSMTIALESFADYDSQYSSSGSGEKYKDTGAVKTATLDTSGSVSAEVVLGFNAENGIAVIYNVDQTRTQHDEDGTKNDTLDGTLEESYSYRYFDKLLKSVQYFTTGEMDTGAFTGPLQVPGWKSTGYYSPKTIQNATNVTAVGRKLLVTTYYDPAASASNYPYKAIAVTLKSPQTYTELGLYLGADGNNADGFTPLAIVHGVFGIGDSTGVVFD